MTPDNHLAFLRFSGGALLGGGLLAALLNLILTPQLPAGAGSVAVNTSIAFGVRMPLAAASVALTTLGCIGLYLAQAHRVRLGALAFLVAGIGGLMAFCGECVQFTLVRDLAFAAPETLERLEEAGSLVRYDTAFAIAIGTFTVGWLAVAIVTLRAGVLRRRGPATLILGMFLVPLLGAVAGMWGAVAGNVVLGSGWALLGFDLRRFTPGTAEATP
jgi:hypothetical protein